VVRWVAPDWVKHYESRTLRFRSLVEVFDHALLEKLVSSNNMLTCPLAAAAGAHRMDRKN